MTGLTVDASVTASFFLDDERDDAFGEIADLVQVAGAAMPAIWCFEVANLLRQGER